MGERACHTAACTAFMTLSVARRHSNQPQLQPQGCPPSLTSRQHKAPGRWRAVVVSVVIPVAPSVAVATIEAATPASPAEGSSRRESEMGMRSTAARAAVQALRPSATLLQDELLRHGNNSWAAASRVSRESEQPGLLPAAAHHNPCPPPTAALPQQCNRTTAAARPTAHGRS